MGKAFWAEGSESLQEVLTGSLAGAPNQWGCRSLDRRAGCMG